MILFLNLQIEHPETMSGGDHKTDSMESPDSIVKGITLEEYEGMKLELEQMKEQLEKEKKEKEELTEMCKQEVKAKEEAVSILRHLKAETLKLAIEEKGKFEAQMVKSKRAILALQQAVESMTQEVRALRMEEETSIRQEDLTNFRDSREL